MFSIRGDSPASDSSPASPSDGGNAGGGAKIVILFVLVVALMAATGYLFVQVTQTRSELAQTREALLDEISKIHETSAVSTQTSRRSVESLRPNCKAPGSAFTLEAVSGCDC